MTLTVQKTSYVTTSIPYVNADPHLGHALEFCIADAYARHRRIRGGRVQFVTGTDDHSLKNVLAAERAGIPTVRWVADRAAAFEALNSALRISPDTFQRTSANPAHAPAVRALWEACARRGDLYRSPYRGLYCVGCERFYEPDELVEERCPEHAAPLELVEETNWFFRLSRYAPAIRDAIESGTLRLVHDGAREETLAFLRGPMRDISVSRSAARARGWGIRGRPRCGAHPMRRDLRQLAAFGLLRRAREREHALTDDDGIRADSNRGPLRPGHLASRTSPQTREVRNGPPTGQQ